MKVRYKVKKIYKDTYQIADWGIAFNVVYIYVLVGKEKALVIDCGYGDLDLIKIIRTFTDKPLVLACAHGHIDHALGTWQFDSFYLAKADFPVYQEHSSKETIERIFTKGIAAPVKDKFLKDPEYMEAAKKIAEAKRPEPTPLEDVISFELGDRQVSWFPIPGHTQGSVAFLDEKNHVVFDSDGCPVMVWIFLPESSTVTEYKKKMEEYYQWLVANNVKKRYMGHQKKPGKAKGAKQMALCAEKIISGKAKPHVLKGTQIGGAEVKIVFSHWHIIAYEKI
jgi:hydroxyacylglutathione hydrolase